jgi:hypothetical protein
MIGLHFHPKHLESLLIVDIRHLIRQVNYGLAGR